MDDPAALSVLDALHPTPAVCGTPRAAALLWLHGRAPAAARIAEPSGWEPTYLRGSGAERGLTA